MRTLSEIVDAIKAGLTPDAEELYWATIALSLLNSQDSRALLHLGHGTDPVGSLARDPVRQADMSFDRNKNAFAADPRAWCGPTFDYRRPEVQRRHQAALRILDHVIAKENQNG